MQWIYDKAATVNYSTVKSLVLAKGQLYTYIQAFGNAQDIKAEYTSTLIDYQLKPLNSCQG